MCQLKEAVVYMCHLKQLLVDLCKLNRARRFVSVKTA